MINFLGVLIVLSLMTANANAESKWSYCTIGARILYDTSDGVRTINFQEKMRINTVVIPEEILKIVQKDSPSNDIECIGNNLKLSSGKDSFHFNYTKDGKLDSKERTTRIKPSITKTLGSTALDGSVVYSSDKFRIEIKVDHREERIEWMSEERKRVRINHLYKNSLVKKLTESGKVIDEIFVYEGVVVETVD